MGGELASGTLSHVHLAPELRRRIRSLYQSNNPEPSQGGSTGHPQVIRRIRTADEAHRSHQENAFLQKERARAQMAKLARFKESQAGKEFSAIEGMPR